MSFFSYFWSGSKKQSQAQTEATAPNMESGIQRIHEAEETQLKREAFLQKCIAKELQLAREAQQKGLKQKALRHLKQKKAYEDQLVKLGGHLANLAILRGKMEEAEVVQVTFQAQQEAANALQQMTLSADKVEDQMDKIRAVIDDFNDVSDRLAQPLDGQLYDEDELLAELDDPALLEEPAVAMPAKPTTTTEVKTRPQPNPTADEADLAALAEFESRMLAA